MQVSISKKSILYLGLLAAQLLNISAQSLSVRRTLLNPFRPIFSTHVSPLDIDNDGDHDMLKCTINDTIQAIWIDDDDDMQITDQEGDLDNDCLIIDRNGDGKFAGPGDLSIDWIDNDGDGDADMQVVVENSHPHIKNTWEWQSNYMWVIDTDNDGIFNYINWKELILRCWTHTGASNFFEDYHGQSLFLKAHIPSYRFADLRFSWENPFLFYDNDNDGLTEMAIRLEDDCYFNNEKHKEIDAYPNKIISRASLTFDLDNDNNAQNRFDFDMSINFRNGGFPYGDQVHRFQNVRGLPESDTLFYDNRWRKLDELIYTSHSEAWQSVFKKGHWGECRLVFDEDDDCERWERVEFYDPRSPFKIGMQKGGIDNNPQADASGDRGEWDMDNSGKGSLYIGFDGKIHLLGAEKGFWRIDQNATYYQGWGGLYEGPYKRNQTEPGKFPTIGYEDTDQDGFFDLIRYDLDGDTLYEQTVDLIHSGIKPDYEIIESAEVTQKEISDFFEKAALKTWENAMLAVEVAKKAKINYQWYSIYMSPKSIWEKYDHGFWLQFYLYFDLMDTAIKQGKTSLINDINKAYYSNNWKLLEKHY